MAAVYLVYFKTITPTAKTMVDDDDLIGSDVVECLLKLVLEVSWCLDKIPTIYREIKYFFKLNVEKPKQKQNSSLCLSCRFYKINKNDYGHKIGG